MPIHDRTIPFGEENAGGENDSDAAENAEEEDGEVDPAEPAAKEEPSEDVETPEEGEEDVEADASKEDEEQVTPEAVNPAEAKPVEQPLESLQKTQAELEQEIAEAVHADPALEAKLDVQLLRRVRRIIKAQPFQKKETPVFVAKTDEDLLKDVNPDDVTLIEKVIKAKGYVPKSEIERERAVQEYSGRIANAVESWIKENPEFNEENDADGSKWQKIKAYIETEFDSPKNPDKVKTFLNDAKSELFPKKSLPEASPHSVAAQKEKIAVSSVKTSGSGASTKQSSSGTPKKEALDPSLKSFLHGFDDEELKDL